MKKKVISLTIDTELTNEEIEKWDGCLVMWESTMASDIDHEHVIRNVRVLDSDEIEKPKTYSYYDEVVTVEMTEGEKAAYRRGVEAGKYLKEKTDEGN